MELFTVQPNAVSGRFVLSNGVAFAEFNPGESQVATKFAQDFANSLQSVYNATLDQLSAFAGTLNIPIMPNTAYLTLDFKSASESTTVQAPVESETSPVESHEFSVKEPSGEKLVETVTTETVAAPTVEPVPSA